MKFFVRVAGAFFWVALSAGIGNAQPVPSTWDGFYAGVSAGLRSSDARWNTVDFGGGAPPVPALTSELYNAASLRGGFYSGYNWQVAPRWVAGVEGDIGFGNKTSGQSAFLPGFSGPFFGFFPGDASSIQLTWDASLRARLGFNVTPSLLVYGTGGVAFQRITLSSTCNFPGCNSATGTDTRTATGYTVGGGLEAPVGGNWLARAEYRYSDYGTIRQTINYPAPLNAPANVDTTLKTHLATIGLAYRFGSPNRSADQVFASAALSPVYNWTGFRAGLSAGARVVNSDWTTTAFTGAVPPTDGRSTENFDSTTFRGGFFGGFDWQFAPRWIAGIEADLSPSAKNIGRDNFLPGVGGIPGFFTINPGDNVTVRTGTDYSLRARFGFLTTPALLAYITGGKAWQQLEFSATCGTGTCGPNASTASTSATVAGWTFGGGLESRITTNILARAEYRYTDFGTVPVHLSDYPFPGFSADAGVTLKTHTVLVGLALAFN